MDRPIQDFIKTPTTHQFPKGRDLSRLKELMLYIAEKSADDALCGATKLNKILFYSDFLAYVAYDESITGVAYQRLPKGPAPRPLLPAKRELISNQDAEEVARVFGVYTQNRLVAKREANVDLFKPSELKLVDWVINLLKNMNAAEVSEMSHGPAWKLTEDNENIPYEWAFLAYNVTAADREQGLKVAQMMDA